VNRAPNYEPWLYVDGRAVAPSVYRPASIVDLGNTVAWWSSLALLGAAVAAAGLLVAGGAGEALAIGGVALFVITASVAGAERIEPATALGASAMIWTSAGIALVLGDRPPLGSVVAPMLAVGMSFLVLGTLGALRARHDGRPRPERP